MKRIVIAAATDLTGYSTAGYRADGATKLHE
jgi:hypothetical protein